jgi:hypothetical protein
MEVQQIKKFFMSSVWHRAERFAKELLQAAGHDNFSERTAW